MSPDRRKRKAAYIVAAAFFAVVACFWTFGKKKVLVSDTAPVGLSSAQGGNRTTSSQTPPSSGVEAAIQRFRSTEDTKVIREQVQELRDLLKTLSPATASGVVRNILDSKVDAATHLSFKVGPDGFLQESPSLRVFLLDYLAQVDAAGAAAYSRTILATMESPDEWAVALRDLARGDKSNEGLSLLGHKMGEMLRHEPWQQNPSVGFLEAFDVAVYLGGTKLIPTLAGLVRKQDNQAVAHAAYLALDRLAISDATETLSSLQANPDLMQGREETRANYFARADVRETAQRLLLEAYLLNPVLGSAELEKFVSLYPNANFMVSHNLLTPVVTPDAVWLRARDAEALHVVQKWLADPRFAALKPQILKIDQRLQEFARQAEITR